MNNFSWTSNSEVVLPDLDYTIVENWLCDVARRHEKLIGDINYTFCNDEQILATNREFLNHDYYTDIITFDRCMGSLLRGDIVISLDTVESNAIANHQPYDIELYRVIVHGLLHLCGINDKGPGERKVMEQEEDSALSLLRDYLK